MAGLFSCLTIAAVLSPISQNWRTNPNDSFPLSYYPMFTAKRERTATITYLVGIDAQGNRRKLHYTFAGEGGLNQVRRQINKMVKKDDEDKLCKSVARKVAKKGRGWTTNVVAVEIRSDTYDLAGYFSGANKAPVKDKVRATCKVQRDTP